MSVSLMTKKRRNSIAIFCCLFLFAFIPTVHLFCQNNANIIESQTKRVPNQPLFEVVNPDYNVSPLTGMSRRNWEDAAMYLLTGAFSYVDRIEDPMVFPKLPGKSYPRNVSQLPTEKLEGLCRTLFIAAPLLKENPDLTIHGIKVADYYRYQIAQLADSNSQSYIKPRSRKSGPQQQLVEFGALSMSLFAAPEVLWNPLPPNQKNALAALLLSYGDGPTVPSNWKFFNIFILSFFKLQGYKVNDALLEEYIVKALAHYRGSGWYNDNPAYDYYSMWAFQMYGPLWAEFFGNKYYPQYAKQFLQNFDELKENYPYMFGRDGRMIMWGRSMSYRFASVVPFPIMGFRRDSAVNYGWMRRLSSGVLLQFLQNPDFLINNVPTLGFYGAFEPAVQSYSCRGSVYWMGKLFFALLLPPDNPFWMAKENDGDWTSGMKKDAVFNKFQKGTDMLITDYPNIGAAEIRPWCNVKAQNASEPFRSSENYNRLSYNSTFPWQADTDKGVAAMNYVFLNKLNVWEPLRLFTFKKFENGIYYRDAVLESNDKTVLHLADIPLANGILRVDKVNSADTVLVHLGHYALPEYKVPVTCKAFSARGYKVQIIDNGIYQLAMVNVAGWDKIYTEFTTGVHPESKKSAVIQVSSNLFPSKKGKVFVTLMLWKRSGEKWTDDELVPVRTVRMDETGSRISIQLPNHETKTILF